MGITVVTLFELERGVRRMERADTEGARQLRLWLDEDVRPPAAHDPLPADEPVATVAARLHVPDPMPEMDALIAATTVVHDLTRVTRNTQDFKRVGIALFNP